MSNLTIPKAVLFDFDGVIVDSFTSHYSAWSLAFEEIFGKAIARFPEATYAGKAPIEIAAYFATVGGDVAKAPILNTLKQEYLLSKATCPTLLPGVKEWYNLLRKLEIPFGIASNAYTSFVKQSMSFYELEFPQIMGVDLFTAPKPSPIPYLTLASTLGVEEIDYASTFIFEDSLTGLQAAAATGMVPIGLLTQYSASELKANGAVHVFSTLKEAFDALEIK